MRSFVFWLLIAAVAATVAARVAVENVVAHTLSRRNYRGLEVPATGGVAVLGGVLTGIGAIALLHVLFTRSQMFAESAGAGMLFIGAAIGFGFIGLWDDLAGTDRDRGWRAHLRAIASGHPTAGAWKVVGGGALALIIGVQVGEGFWWSLVNALVIALSANALNLLDKRPARASKTFLLAAVGVMFVGNAVAPSLAAAIGAVVLYLPFDMRERLMLGDAGSNGLGAMLGVATVLGSTHGFRLLALLLLAATTVAGARPGLSRFIDAVPILRRFDRAGRVSVSS